MKKKKFHYTLVRNNSRLLSNQHSEHDGKIFRCWNCFNVFHNEDKLFSHTEYCSKLNTQNMIMPKPGTILKFKNHKHVKRYPFIIYADFECTTNKMEYCNSNPENSYTTKIQSMNLLVILIPLYVSIRM